jgi:uncharacterized protein (TIGR00297 family)
MQSFITGVFAAAVISLLAYRAGSLNKSGALAAAVLGSLVFGAGGLSWAVLLIAFFVSSSGLSKLFGRQKAAFNEKFAKGARRDAGQVLANGGIGGVFVLLHLAFPHALWPWLGFAGAMAAVNADTWATELGVLSRSTPRLISTGKPVERGTSGGITFEGTLAALAGSGLIAGLAVLLAPGASGRSPAVFGIILLSGLGGSLVDSLLGATFQAIYFCPACGKETEHHPLHLCGNATTLLRGRAWLGNDWVNIACALAGALLSAGLPAFL